MTALRAVGAVLVAAHLGLLAYGIRDPDAILRFDRTGKRLAAAERLLDAPSVELLVSGGAPGDYAWHAAALGLTGGWLPGVAVLQLLVAAASLVAVYRLVLWLDGGRDAALLAVVFYAAVPIDFAIPHFLASEAFFNPLVIAGAALVVRYALHRPDGRTLGLAGFAFGLAALTRTEILPWLLVVVGLVAGIARRVAPARAPVHVALLAALAFGGAGAWLVLAPAPPVDLERASVSVDWELANRAHRVVSAAGGETAGIEAAPWTAFGRAAVDHPASFVREWALQVGKLLALPDNLDVFRYLGLYEYTGRRADWVHDLGVAGAVRAAFAEMPWLAGWLAVSVCVWCGFLLLALGGAWHCLRASRAEARLVAWLLVSLPVAWIALRVLTQGESRKRSPVDFVLAVFAALAVVRARRVKGGPPQ